MGKDKDKGKDSLPHNGMVPQIRVSQVKHIDEKDSIMTSTPLKIKQQRDMVAYHFDVKAQVVLKPFDVLGEVARVVL